MIDGIKPLFTLSYRGFVQAWVYRGDQLKPKKREILSQWENAVKRRYSRQQDKELWKNMNDLEKYFTENTEGLIHKWKHYFEIYDRHLSPFRNTDCTIVEFGVSQGGSLQMWKNYFGKKCKIFGIDINPHCKKFEDDQIQIFIGDQEDRKFLKSLLETIPRIDILIDDGGHTMRQQINTFEELFHFIDENGVCLCEDLHTSYCSKWGGGYRKDGTFIEYSKNFVDYINAWHSKSRKLRVTEFTKSVHSLHFYSSVLVIEKRPIERPFALKSGMATIQNYHSNTIIRLGSAIFFNATQICSIWFKKGKYNGKN